MKCYKCGSRKARVRVPSLEKKACDECFKQIIEKRFNRTVRGMNLKEVIVKLGRPSDKVLLHLFKKRAARVRELSVKSSKKESSINQSTLDDICVSVLKSFFKGEDCLIKEESPLESISEYELIEYAQIEGLAFNGNPRTGEEERIHEFIMELDERRPGVMYSIKDFMKKLQ
ncbi:hypothetical protein GF352_04345 [archaeon]|nr:hypothetical protein [archaeon]